MDLGFLLLLQALLIDLCLALACSCVGFNGFACSVVTAKLLALTPINVHKRMILLITGVFLMCFVKH